jgi:hypothetical protein
LSLPLPARITGELLRGLSCRRLYGSVVLKGDALEIDLRALVQTDDARAAALWRGMAPIEPTWLRLLPSSGTMAVLTMAFRPTREFWDSAFELANRLEKTDPAHAETAPVRARLNLLARAAGVRLEADLWPHLKGFTVGVLGEPDRPGRPTGAILAFHLDSEAAAEQLLKQSAPGLAKLLGREVAAWRNGQDLLVAWGTGVATAAREAAARPERSVAPLCAGALESGKPAPNRLLVFWPARCLPLGNPSITRTTAWSVVADDPPALWQGWNDEKEGKALDSVRWPELKRRIRRFLEQIPPEQISAR